MPSSSYVYGPINDSHGYPVRYDDRARTWTNTPGYSTAQRDTLPINSYTDPRRWYEQFAAPFYRVSKSTGATSEYAYWAYTLLGLHDQHAYGWSILDKPVVDPSVLRNEALLKALVKIADAKTNIPVLYAEAAKTSDLILGKANQIYRAYRAFRRGNLREVARTLNISPRNVHKTWLEYKYGWMPVLMDVKNSAEFLAQQSLGGRPPRFVVSASASASSQKTVIEPNPSQGPGSYNYRVASGERRVKVKIWCEIDNPHFNQLQQLGLTNPALVAWELVPFSFVFDWFVSVGDYLTGLTALHGVSVLRAMVSSEASYDHTWGSVWTTRSDTSYTYLPGSAHIHTRGRTYNRDPLSVDPSSVTPPVNRDPFSWNRLVSGLALLRAQGSRLNLRI